MADHSRALELDPTLADAHTGRAWIYLLQGEYQDALREQQEARDLGANNSDLQRALENSTQR
jgi:Tfp pilus assembly protein PilF